MDIRYLAGLIDGEGTITLSREHARAKVRRPVLSIQMCDEELIREICLNYGGTVVVRHPRSANSNPSWTWTLTNDRAVKLLHQLRPHLRLRSKRLRAAFILDLLTLSIVKNGRYTEDQLNARKELEDEFFRLTPTRMSPISPTVDVEASR